MERQDILDQGAPVHSMHRLVDCNRAATGVHSENSGMDANGGIGILVRR
jgi:hypothetical protein